MRSDTGGRCPTYFGPLLDCAHLSFITPCEVKFRFNCSSAGMSKSCITPCELQLSPQVELTAGIELRGALQLASSYNCFRFLDPFKSRVGCRLIRRMQATSMYECVTPAWSISGGGGCSGGEGFNFERRVLKTMAPGPELLGCACSNASSGNSILICQSPTLYCNYYTPTINRNAGSKEAIRIWATPRIKMDYSSVWYTSQPDRVKFSPAVMLSGRAIPSTVPNPPREQHPHGGEFTQQNFLLSTIRTSSFRLRI